MTAERRKVFLAELAKRGIVVHACDAAGVHRQAVFRARQSDPDFDRACDDAMERYRARLVREVDRRGLDGVLEPIYQGGKLVGHRRVYSDRLLEMSVKAKCPEFRDRPAEVNVTQTTVNVVNVETLPRAVRDQLRAVAEAMRAAAAPVVDVEALPAPPAEGDSE